MSSLTYLSENSQHLLFAKFAIDHLQRNGCEVRVNGGSSLGFFKRGNLLLNDRDVDFHVPNKSYDEINEIMRPVFRQDKGVATLGGRTYTFYKTRNTGFKDFKFDLDITTPDNYWSYSGTLAAQKIVQLFAEPARRITVQGLEFPIPNKLKETLILCFEKYTPKPGEFAPVYDEDDLDLGRYLDAKFVIAGKFDPFHYAHRCLIERIQSFTGNLRVLLYSSEFLQRVGVTGVQSDAERLDYMRCHGIVAELYDGGPGHEDATWVIAADDEEGAKAWHRKYIPDRDAIWVRRMKIRCLLPE